MIKKLLDILNILRPCKKYGHWWSEYCSSAAPRGRSVVTGRRCKKCREIQVIEKHTLMGEYDTLIWETRKRCIRCDDFCALDGTEFCAGCSAKILFAAK